MRSDRWRRPSPDVGLGRLKALKQLRVLPVPKKATAKGLSNQQSLDKLIELDLGYAEISETDCFQLRERMPHTDLQMLLR